MRDKYFSILIMVFFAIVGVYCFAFPQNETSLFEKRGLHTNENLEESSFVDNSFQNDVEKILADQFPFRNVQMTMYYQMKMFLYKPVMITQNPMDLLRVTDNSNIVGKSDRMIYDLPEYDFKTWDYAASRAYNISSLAKQNEEVNFYIYKPVRPEEKTWFNNESNTSYVYKFEENFLANLDPSIGYYENSIFSWEDYQKYYYQADHHWNIDGAYMGYREIIDILSQDFNLGNIREVVSKQCFEQEFYGSFSYKVARVSVPDYICDLELEDQQEFKTTVDGKRTTDGNKALFINGDVPKYEALYELYYGDNSFERIYDYGENTGLNLVIVSDSFSNPINAWIASHFDTTVVLDPRASGNRKDAYLNKYIEKYNADAVLYLMNYESLYISGYFHIPVE